MESNNTWQLKEEIKALQIDLEKMRKLKADIDFTISEFHRIAKKNKQLIQEAWLINTVPLL